MSYLIQILTSSLAIGSIYGMIALGFVIIYKSSSVLNMAQGSLVMFGSFVCYAFSVQMGLPFYLAALATAVFAIIFGLVIERILLRPMIGQPLLGVVLMTIGLMFCVDAIANMIWGPEIRGYSAYLPSEGITIGDIRVSSDYIAGFLISICLFIAITLYFRFSRSGITMRAVADNQQVAQSMGVSISRTFGVAWALACLAAAVGGIVLGTIMRVGIFLSPLGLKAFPAVIVGGIDSIGGALVGGIIIGVLEGLSGGYLDPILTGVKEVAPFVILLLVLVIKPYGLFGQKRIERI